MRREASTRVAINHIIKMAKEGKIPEPFGYLMTLDLYECKEETVDDLDLCYHFLEEMVAFLKMEQQAPPFIFHSDRKKYPDKAGLSGWIPLIESGIQIHTLIPKNFISIDVYSCSSFSTEGVEKFVTKWFNPERIEKAFIERGTLYNVKQASVDTYTTKEGLPIIHTRQVPNPGGKPVDRRRLDYTEQVARVAARYLGIVSSSKVEKDILDLLKIAGQSVTAASLVNMGVGTRAEILGALGRLAGRDVIEITTDGIGRRRYIMKTAKYQDKKTVKKQDGGDMIVYEYSDRQIANRNKEKAGQVEKLRHSIGGLRAQVRKDLTSDDENTRAVALAIGLMDVTYERIGNAESAKEGHFGVTGWKKKHLTFGDGKVTIRYVGKSGVDHEKVVDTPASVKALKEAVKDKSDNDDVVDASAEDVNAYLKKFDISAKDIRGYHANTEMQTRLKAVRAKGGKLPTDKKEREKKLKAEFKEALEGTAEAVGHEAATLRSQYLVPGLEKSFCHDGSILKRLDGGVT